MVTPKKESKFRRLTDSISTGGILTPHLEQALMTKGESSWPSEYAIKIYNKERHWDGLFHPSSHTDSPELQLFYEFSPKYAIRREPPTVDLIMTFQVGSAFHSLLQSMLLHLGFCEEEDIETHFVNVERHCSGTVDVRKITLPNGKTYPLEIKSAGFLPKEPSEKYLRQLQVYMDVGCGEVQEEGIILYLEKNHPHRFREFLVRRDEKILNDIYGKWNRVLEAIEFDDPSMLEFPCHAVNSKAHQECPARNVCLLGPPTSFMR